MYSHSAEKYVRQNRIRRNFRVKTFFSSVCPRGRPWLQEIWDSVPDNNAYTALAWLPGPYNKTSPVLELKICSLIQLYNSIAIGLVFPEQLWRKRECVSVCLFAYICGQDVLSFFFFFLWKTVLPKLWSEYSTSGNTKAAEFPWRTTDLATLLRRLFLGSVLAYGLRYLAVGNVRDREIKQQRHYFMLKCRAQSVSNMWGILPECF